MIIADDEKIIRESLADFIDWGALGIRIAACCSNGVEALEAIIDESPDIVMTDIKMPGLNGLELIEKTQGIDREIEFIILSGYKEFEFAKQAMKFGVRRYILKPLDEEQLVDAVEDAKRHYAQRQSANTAIQERRRLRRQVREHQKRLLMYDLFAGEARRREAAARYGAEVGECREGYVAAFYSCLRGEDLRDFSRCIYGLLEKEGSEPLVDCLYVKNTLVVLTGNTRPDLEWKLTQAAGDRELVCSTAVYPGLDQALEEVTAKLMRYAKVWMVDSAGGVVELYDEGISTDRLDDLLGQLDRLGAGAGEAEVKELLYPHVAKLEDTGVLQGYAVHLLTRLVLSGETRDFIKPDLPRILDRIYQTDEPEAVRSLLVREVAGALAAPDGERSLVDAVKDYVDSHLADSNLSLKQIAKEQVHMNVDYLSRLFVRRTGEKFSHYLNRRRIETAKLLLKQDSSKIYQVAEQVGCGHNPRYFSQIFKKYTGMTPSAYVESLQLGNQGGA